MLQRAGTWRQNEFFHPVEVRQGLQVGAGYDLLTCITLLQVDRYSPYLLEQPEGTSPSSCPHMQLMAVKNTRGKIKEMEHGLSPQPLLVLVHYIYKKT